MEERKMDLERSRRELTRTIEARAVVCQGLPVKSWDMPAMASQTGYPEAEAALESAMERYPDRTELRQTLEKD